MRRRLLRDERGATAIEFAIVAPVLVVALLGLCDLAHTLYMTASLQGIVQKVARDATLQDDSTDAAKAALDAKVTKAVVALDAAASVVPTRRYYKTYAAAAAKAAEPWTDTNNNQICDAGEPFTDTNNNGVWDKDGGDSSGGAKDRTVYTVAVSYPRLFPVGALLGLPSTVNLQATTVLENQPYADQTQYATAGTGKCS